MNVTVTDEDVLISTPDGSARPLNEYTLGLCKEYTIYEFQYETNKAVSLSCFADIPVKHLDTPARMLPYITNWVKPKRITTTISCEEDFRLLNNINIPITAYLDLSAPAITAELFKNPNITLIYDADVKELDVVFRVSKKIYYPILQEHIDILRAIPNKHYAKIYIDHERVTQEMIDILSDCDVRCISCHFAYDEELHQNFVDALGKMRVQKLILNTGGDHTVDLNPLLANPFIHEMVIRTQYTYSSTVLATNTTLKKVSLSWWLEGHAELEAVNKRNLS